MIRKTLIRVLLAVTAAWAMSASAADGKSTVYFFTFSNGCECTQKECKAAEPLAEKVKMNLTPNAEYRHLDYGKTPEVVKPLMEKYKLFAFPAMLVVAPDGSSSFQAQGKLEHEAVLAKLREAGVVKATP